MDDKTNEVEDADIVVDGLEVEEVSTELPVEVEVGGASEEDPEEDTEEAASSNDRVVTGEAIVMDRMNQEGMINRYLGDLEKLREKLKSVKEMFEDGFNNDPLYAEQAEKVKAETRKKTEIRQKMLKQESFAQLQSQVNYVKEEMKETQEALSAHVQEYYKATGVSQITDDKGEIREIIIVTKLVKKGGKYRP